MTRKYDILTHPQNGQDLAFDHLEALDVDLWLTNGALIAFDDTAYIGFGEAFWDSSPAPHGNKKALCFYFPDFFLQDPKPWVHYQYETLLPISLLRKLLAQLPIEKQIAPIRWQEPERSLFQDGFQTLQEAFKDCKLDKAVLYAFSKRELSLSKADRQKALKGVLGYASTTPTYAYGFWSNSEGLIGATPEMLFHAQADKLQTMALAGTQKASDKSDMREDLKLVREHKIVVDDIKTRLKPFGHVVTGSMQIRELPLLKHLYTSLEMQLFRPLDFSALVTILHPTPALGGFPSESAWLWLKGYNVTLPRGRFGAPVGLLMNHAGAISNEIFCFVGIRNVMWDSKSQKIGAGCGIIAESDLDAEWAELLLKTTSILRFLNL